MLGLRRGRRYWFSGKLDTSPFSVVVFFSSFVCMNNMSCYVCLITWFFFNKAIIIKFVYRKCWDKANTDLCITCIFYADSKMRFTTIYVRQFGYLKLTAMPRCTLPTTENMFYSCPTRSLFNCLIGCYKCI